MDVENLVGPTAVAKAVDMISGKSIESIENECLLRIEPNQGIYLNQLSKKYDSIFFHNFNIIIFFRIS